MATQGDLLKVTHFGTYLGQEVLNVFFYAVNSLTEPSSPMGAWTDEYIADFQANVMQSLNSNFTVNTLVWENLSDPLEIATIGVAAAGAAITDPLPSSVALGVKLNRNTRITRSGYKRFPGMSENVVSGNVHSLPAGEIANIELFCGTTRIYLDYDGSGNNVALEPVIIGRTKDVNGVYQLDITKVNQILGAEVSPTVSTQNTRKP